jgi:microcystin-dependent protein
MSYNLPPSPNVSLFNPSFYNNLTAFATEEWVAANFQPLGSAPPTGSIITMAVECEVSGYLLCDGRTYPQSQYPALFNLLHFTYGSNPLPLDQTVFFVPNFQGAFLRGAGTTTYNGSTYTSNTTGVLQMDQNQAHNHTLTDNGHRHEFTQTPISANQSSSNYVCNPYGGNTQDFNGTNGSTIDKTGITIAPSGGNESRPMNFAIWYYIKT